MKAVTMDQLHRDATEVLAAVEAGATYAITRNSQVIGRIVPGDAAPDITPPKNSGAAQTRLLDRVELTSAASIDDLIDDARADW